MYSGGARKPTVVSFPTVRALSSSGSMPSLPFLSKLSKAFMVTSTSAVSIPACGLLSIVSRDSNLSPICSLLLACKVNCWLKSSKLSIFASSLEIFSSRSGSAIPLRAFSIFSSLAFLYSSKPLASSLMVSLVSIILSS